jgi:hypothetical protein
MALRNGHGTGSGVPRVEVLPADELPQGVQAPALASARGERRPDGTFAPGARTMQAAGGRATAGKTRLTARLGLASLPDLGVAAVTTKDVIAVTHRRREPHDAVAERTGGDGVAARACTRHGRAVQFYTFAMSRPRPRMRFVNFSLRPASSSQRTKDR